MKLTEFLVPENIHYGVLVSSKKRALELIGKYMADYLNAQHLADLTETHQFCPVICFSQLFKRERLGTTALNNGIALPHSKLPTQAALNIEQPIAVFVQLENEIDFDAEDRKPVDLVYAMLFPEQQCEQYNAGLATLASRLADKNLLKQLRAAESAEDIWHILSYADQHFDTQQGE